MSDPDYRLTPDAEEDFLGIWSYTRDAWGEVQADSYVDALHRCCAAIAAGSAISRAVIGIDRVRVHRCHHHLIFFTMRDGIAVILAAQHERMDLLARLKGRLGM